MRSLYRKFDSMLGYVGLSLGAIHSKGIARYSNCIYAQM